MTRETDTPMVTLVPLGISGAIPHSSDKEHAWDQEAVKYWARPISMSVTMLRLTYFMCVSGPCSSMIWGLPFEEPVKTLLYNGHINAPDENDKSKGNVIDPLDVIDSGYGADTLRTYELFIGPYNEDA